MFSTKKVVAAVLPVLLAVAVLAGCSAPKTDGRVLEKHGVAAVDARAFIDELEATPLTDRTTDFIASVRADDVVLIDAETEEQERIPLPDDLFYLSVAPYINETHPCGFHSLTTCVGELANAAFDVTITDVDGQVVLQEAVTSEDNGFFGLWLPRGIDGEIRVEHDGLTATGPLSTRDDAKTCETDLRLG